MTPTRRPRASVLLVMAQQWSQRLLLLPGDAELQKGTTVPSMPRPAGDIPGLTARGDAGKPKRALLDAGLEAPPPRPPLGGDVGGASPEVVSCTLLARGGRGLQSPKIAATLSGCSWLRFGFINSIYFHLTCTCICM